MMIYNVCDIDLLIMYIYNINDTYVRIHCMLVQ